MTKTKRMRLAAASTAALIGLSTMASAGIAAAASHPDPWFCLTAGPHARLVDPPAPMVSGKALAANGFPEVTHVPLAQGARIADWVDGKGNSAYLCSDGICENYAGTDGYAYDPKAEGASPFVELCRDVISDGSMTLAAAGIGGVYGKCERPEAQITSLYPVYTTNLFSDVPASHPFAKDISWLAGKQITTGWSDGTFRPQDSVSRAAFAAFLYRHSKADYTPPKASKFKDVPTTHPFYKEISWAESKGITKGWSDATFRPEQKISRDAIAAFLHRYADPYGIYSKPATKTFKDIQNSEHKVHIEWMASKGISTGWPDGTFRPGAATERGAIAAFLHRFDAARYK